MGVIVFHVGMAKAGSSSVQQWLGATAPRLASDLGVHPMRIVRSRVDGSLDVAPTKGDHVRSLLVGVRPLPADDDVAPESVHADAQRVMERLDAVAQTHGTIVLTNEAYQLPFWRADEDYLAELDNLAGSHRVRVAYYVRPQQTAMEAAWRQWGFRLPIPASKFLRRRVRQLRYLETLETVTKLAPHVAFEVRPFRDDLLVGGDVVVDFATAFLAAENLVPPATEGRRSNLGLPLELVALLRDGEDTFWTSQHDNEALDRLRGPVTGWEIPESEAVRRSRLVLRNFCAREFEPGNRVLIERLGWDTTHFVPPVPDGLGAWEEHGTEESPDGVDALDVLDRLWSSQASDAERALLFRALSQVLSTSEVGDP